MNIFRRAAAGSTSLSSATSFLGIGQNPVAAAAPLAVKPKGDDDESMTAEEKAAADKKASDEREAAAATAAAEDCDDDEEDDEAGDDDSDEKEFVKGGTKKASVIRSARLRERSRIAAILGHPSAAANPNAAAKMALCTNLTRSQAAALLGDMPKAAAGTGLSALMAAHGPAAPQGSSSPLSAADKMHAGWTAALKQHAFTDAKLD